MYKRAHNPLITEKRGDLLTSREMPVVSYELGVTGKCDVVEFHRCDEGVNIFGREGKWLPVPVEYKRGKAQRNDSDRLQLCAQAICLEEMLNCPPIESAYIYYGETARREAVALSAELREKVRSNFAERWGYYWRGYTPRVKARKVCGSCSLKDVCLPKMPESNVKAYIEKRMNEGA